MGMLQPYSGKFVNAESASSKIDAIAIINGCDAVDNEAAALLNINKEVNGEGKMITEDALSIDGITITDNLNECCDGISMTYDSILNITAQIRSAALDAYNRIQDSLNADACRRDNIAIAEHNEKR